MSIRCCNGYVPPKRHEACWGHCPDYIAEKAVHDAEKAADDKKRSVQGGIISQKINGVNRAMKANKPVKSKWKRRA